MGCLSWPLSAYIDGERGDGGKGEVRCSLVMGYQEYVIDEVFHRLREGPEYKASHNYRNSSCAVSP